MNWLKPLWPVPTNIRAAVTLRTGGVSTGHYASLNPALHVNDNVQHVLSNRNIIQDMLNLPDQPFWLQQVHGINVVKAGKQPDLPEADASYTDQTNSVCAVLTADCLPVLLCGDNGRVIAVAHAGWRGLHAGIISETLKQMACQNVLAWLGPAIGPNQFEIGEDVYSAFVTDNPMTAKAFRQIKPEKWLADIYHLARINLIDSGVNQIYGGNYCTVSEPENFFSYRRDGSNTGRMATLIWRVAY